MLLLDSPFTGDGDSSFDFRFSVRGGRNAVGDVLGVFVEFAPLPLPVDDNAGADVDEDGVALAFDKFVVVVVDPDVTVRPPRPLVPPLRNLE